MYYGTIEIKETLTNHFLIWALLYFLATVAIYNGIMIAVDNYRRAKMQRVVNLIETGHQKRILEEKIRKQKEEIAKAEQLKAKLGEQKVLSSAGRNYGVTI